ncbi:MAG: BspA family leucine-rich repeat surface protein, partial [Eggerthellaceae bacterium]|nr:BspA family leucine-rich repeat surface protein [Eggerthellaceae bacterium]
MSSLALAGLSTDAMPGDYSTMGDLSGMSEMFDGATLIATADGSAASQAVNITLGAKFGKILNGFFGAKATGAAAHTYIMASSVSIQLGAANGPQSANNLMPRPNWNGQGFSGKVFIGNLTLQKNVWAARDYGLCIQYTESDVNDVIGDFGSAFGRTVAYGFIGAPSQASGESVAWRLMVKDEVGTLCIAPNAKRNYSASTPGTMRDFTDTNTAPWTGVGMAGGDGDGYSKSFTNVKVWPGVTAGASLQAMFKGCSNLANADLTNLTVGNSTTNLYQMFMNTNVTSFRTGIAATAATASSVAEGVRVGTGFTANGSAVNASFMFLGCNKMTDVSMSACFNGDNVNLNNAFAGLSLLKSVTLNNVGNGAAANMQQMFAASTQNASSVTSAGATVTLTNVGTGAGVNLDVTGEKLVDMTSMFNSANGVRRVTLTDVGTKEKTVLRELFANSQSITNVTATRVATGARANAIYLFHRTGTGGNIPANTTSSYVFDNVCSNGANFSHILSYSITAANITTSKVEWKNSLTSTGCLNSDNMMYRCGAETIDVRGMPNWLNGTNNVTSNGAQFQELSKIRYVCNGLPTDSVNNAESLYAGASYTTGYLALPNDATLYPLRWHTNYMLAGCPNLEIVYMTNFSGYTMTGFVMNCSKLKRFKMTGQGIYTVGNTHASDIFANDTVLERVEITSTRAYSPYTFAHIFYNCSNLSYVDLTGMSTGTLHVALQGRMSDLFDGATKIVKMGGTGSETTSTPATVKIGTGWNRVWNGLFWYQTPATDAQWNTEWGTTAPKWMMYANTNVEVNVGPTSASNLIRNLEITVNGVSYKYEGSTNANFKYTGTAAQKQIWINQGYFGGLAKTANIGYANSTTPTNAVTYTMSNNNKDMVIKANSANAQMMAFGTSNSNGVMVAPWYNSATLETVTFQGYSGTKVKARQLTAMFMGCTKLKSVNFTNLDTSTVTDMTSMFESCTSLTSVNFNVLDTSKVTTMSRTFNGCSSLPSLDLSSNNLTSLTSLHQAFYNCRSLKGKFAMDNTGEAVKFPARGSDGWALSKLQNLRMATFGCAGITSLELKKFGTQSTYIEMGELAYSTSIKTIVMEDFAHAGFRSYNLCVNQNIIETASFTNVGGVLDSQGKAPTRSYEDDLAYSFNNCPNLKSVTITNSFNNAGRESTIYGDHHMRGFICGSSSPETVTIKDSFNGDNKFVLSVFSGYTTNRANTSVTLQNCFNGAQTGTYSRYRWIQLFNNNPYLRNVTMTDCLKADGLELIDLFMNCPRLENVNLTRVATGKGTSVARMFNNVGNSIESGKTCTWSLTDVANNYANTRAMFTNSLGSTGISASSSLTWANSGTRGKTVTMGAMFSNGTYTPTSTEYRFENATYVYSYDYSLGTYEGGTPSYYYPSAAAANKMMMPKIDLRGMPAMATSAEASAAGMTPSLGADLSAFRMFNNCDAITTVGTTTDCSLVLPADLVNSNMTQFECMFADCDRLKEVKLTDFAGAFYSHYQEMFRGCTALEKFTWSATKQGADAATFNIMFMGCTALKEVRFDSAAYPVTPSNMIEMFNGCKALKLLDTTGLSTASLAMENLDAAAGLGATQMGNMFVACDGLFSTTDRAQIILGKEFKQVQNGFIWYRGGENATPVYTIQADIIVNGLVGPTSAAELMRRPQLEGHEYSGMVYLNNMPTNADGSLTDASRAIWSAWDAREYVNLTVNGKKNDLSIYGNVSATGNVGKDDGTATWNGTSVKWVLCTNDDTQLTTLAVYAADNVSGIMRKFNRVDSTRAPWNGSSVHGTEIDQVVFVGRVTAEGSLAGMFEGCTNLTSADLRGLTITDATTDMSYIFSGCSSLKTIRNNATGDYEASTEMAEGAIIPTSLQPTDARYAFQNCTGVTSLTLSGFATRPAADLRYMLAGAGAANSSLELTNVAANAPAAELSHMADGAKFKTVKAELVGNGSASDMSYAFANMRSLTDITINNVGNVGATDASYMLMGCTNLPAVQITNSFNGASADATRMLAGNAALERVTMTDVLKGTGAVAVSLAEGATGLGTVRMMDVATGANADASRAFAGCTGLTDVNLTRVAAGQRAVAREMFAGASVFGETGISVQGISDADVAPAAQASIRSMDAY